jgi:hypothetical protein
VFDGAGDHRRVAELIVRAGDKFEVARRYLAPPLITYKRESKSAQPASTGPADGTNPTRKTGPTFNLFAFLLPGLASMFLLFLGNTAMGDFRRELQQRTLARLRTLRPGLLPFVTSKVLFSVVMLLVSAAIMLGAGGLLFRIDWRVPLAIMTLTISYCVFASGFTALLGVAVVNEERGDAFGNVAAMAGGWPVAAPFRPSNCPPSSASRSVPGCRTTGSPIRSTP